MNLDNTNWQYYYKLKPDGTSSISNLLYTPTVNSEGTIMCMHYCCDSNYRKYESPISEDVITWFFNREVKFLKELAHLDSTPQVYEIDIVNRKIFIEWNKETLSQIIFNPDRNLDQEVPHWKEQVAKILKDIKSEDCWKMSLYPHCFYVSKDNKLKTIDYYSVIPFSEQFVERKLIEEIIGREGAYRFDESTDNGYIDFKKFFEITITRHLTGYWTATSFAEIFKEVYND
jgi:hypothetical protein